MSNKIKNVPIRYTSRDFESIKTDLIEHAKRYYPNTHQDFSEASFGSLMFDAVAYVGDILSFYLDYQANETFLDTAIEYENVIKLGKQMGYRFRTNPSSYGTATFYIIIPASTTGSPDANYSPILRRGSEFSTTAGSKFLLLEDVDFADVSNETVVATNDSTTGSPTSFAIRAQGQVLSGEVLTITETIGPFEKFRRVELPNIPIAEIISVTDSEGNDFLEVDYLSQNVLYKPILNMSKTEENAPTVLLKPFFVPRRYVVEQGQQKTFIQFGYGSDQELTSESIKDPVKVVLQKHGKDHVSELSLDPSKMIETDKFGISPSNTTLTITFRANTQDNVNAFANSLTEIVTPLFKFSTEATSASAVATVSNSLEITNETPIVGDVANPSAEELKHRISNTFASQHRAVTQQDYKAMVFMMPPEFGSIKRCSVMRDHDSFRRNLNLFVISEDRAGNLTTTHSAIKSNLKHWINRYRMVNDTVDIVDAEIVNVGIDFSITAEQSFSKQTVLNNATQALFSEFETKFDIGEPFSIARVYRVLNNVDGILDVMNVKVVHRTELGYTGTLFSIKEQTSLDGKYISIPQNLIFEIKNPEDDIKGAIR